MLRILFVSAFVVGYIHCKKMHRIWIVKSWHYLLFSNNRKYRAVSCLEVSYENAEVFWLHFYSYVTDFNDHDRKCNSTTNNTCSWLWLPSNQSWRVYLRLGSLWSTAPWCCLEPRGWNRQPGPSTVQNFAILSVPGNQNFYERNSSLLANAILTDTTSKAEPGLNLLENACHRTLCCKVHYFSI